MNTRQGDYTVLQPKYKLNLAREGFIYRGAAIFNKLGEGLRKEPKLQKFKDDLKDWIKMNISIRPKQIFQSIVAGSQGNQAPPPPPPPEPPPPPQQRPRRQNLITMYLVPRERNVAVRVNDEQAEAADEQAL